MIRNILHRFMKFKGPFYLVNVLLIVVYVCQLLIPYVFSGFIDEITQNAVGNISYMPILTISILTIILMGSSYAQHILSEVLITKTAYEFLKDVDYKLEHIPIRKTEKYNPAYLNNRIFNDILTTLGFVVHHFIVAIIMVISTLVLFVLIILINPFLVLIPLTALTINVAGILIFNKEYYKRGYQFREDNNQYVSDNNDLIAHIKETKIHSWYDISGESVRQSFITLLKSGISLNKVLALLNNIGTFSKNITLVLTMFIGGTLIVNNTITIGEFILITYYTNMCLNYSEYFLKFGQERQHAKVSYDRLEEFFDIDDENNGVKKINKIHKIKVSNLSYAYPESPRLFTNLNVTFEAGKIYCLKGKNGEGKSTFIDILLGLDYNFTGSIKYNNSDICELDMIHTRKDCISVVLQEPRMQRLSVFDNITRGIDEYSEDELKSLIDLLGVRDIVENKESLTLSGGEKQKISIIRAFLKNPSILIMDEPVSALDSGSINDLKKVLVKNKDNLIVILVSHNDVLFDVVDEFIEFPKTKV